MADTRSGSLLFYGLVKILPAPVHHWHLTISNYGSNQVSLLFQWFAGTKMENNLDFGCIFRSFLLKTIEARSSLAMRTVMSPPSSYQNASDRRLATAAGKPRALVDAMFQLEKTTYSVGIHVIAHR